MSSSGEATVTYSIPEPFEQALALLRAGIPTQDLMVTGELDLEQRLAHDLGLQIGPCRILCVCSAAAMVEAVLSDPALALFLPLHVVVSEGKAGTEVHIPSARNPACSELSQDSVTIVREVRVSTARAIERIAMHSGARSRPAPANAEEKQSA